MDTNYITLSNLFQVMKYYIFESFDQFLPEKNQT